MTSPDLSSRPSLSLLALPTEIHAAILTHLRFPDLHTLRLANHYFYVMIPPPIHAELLTFETLDFAVRCLILFSMIRARRRMVEQIRGIGDRMTI
jgi:hypothetical protein